MTETITKDRVLAALKSVKTPSGADLVSANILSEIVITNNKVYFALNVPKAAARAYEAVRRAAEEAVKAIEGVKGAAVTLTAEAEGHARAGAGEVPGKGIGAVKHVIAVASGKGGVGKSTTAVNLALGLKENGLAVGILDADIYGPSLPRLLGIQGLLDPVYEDAVRPRESFGLKVMSMGFLVAEEKPMIWRGPMVASALTQLLQDVAWGSLDVLVVDMPPGTGDAQLTLAQRVPLSGAVIVSTPQDLALIDARKGLNMFKSVNVPVLGIVENMSYFVCPKCGEHSHIFGHGGARREAERLGVAFLGEVPLTMAIRETSDGGHPIVIAEPQSASAQIYRDIAAKVWQGLTSAKAGRAAPKIVME